MYKACVIWADSNKGTPLVKVRWYNRVRVARRACMRAFEDFCSAQGCTGSVFEYETFMECRAQGQVWIAKECRNGYA